MGLKVLILGLSPTRGEIAWDGYEVWGMGWDPDALQMHRVFEMHDRATLALAQTPGGYFERLRDCARVYVHEPLPEVPEAVVYPFDAVAQTTGDYWCSSVAYMLALAIHEGADEIALYGVDGTEQYAYQHPNINYLLGLARGRGVRVALPQSCPLLRFVSDPDYDYAGRYGALNGRDH